MKRVGRWTAVVGLLGAVGCGDGSTGGPSDTTGSGSASETDGDAGDGGSGSTDGGSGSGTDTSTGGGTGSTTTSEPDCADGCEPNDFNVEHLSGINYAGRMIHLLAPACEGEICPDPFTEGTARLDPIGPCEETQDAMDSPRGPEEWCRIAPIAVAFGIEIGFTTEVDADTIREVRQRIDDPSQDEEYIWHSEIVELRGPRTRYKGDWTPGIGAAADVVANARNLACIAALEDEGEAPDWVNLDTQCNRVRDVGGRPTPLRTELDAVIEPYRGRRDARRGNCDTPPSGPDDCCSACDYELSINVAKYGVDGGDRPRSPNDGTALACAAGSDPYVSCRGFVPRVDRDDETFRFGYTWGAVTDDFELPLYDRLRQTHPDDWPAGAIPAGNACTSAADCQDDRSQACVGTDAGGQACSLGASCTGRRCVPRWFIECRADQDIDPSTGYCIDTRFYDRGAGACFTADAPFDGIDPATGLPGQAPAGARFAYCDGDLDAMPTPGECCQASLGGGATCDPWYQDGIEPLPRFDRHPELAAEAHCACVDPAQPGCADVVDQWCEPPLGTQTDPELATFADGYAAPFVSAIGGVRYEEELGGFELRPAHIGNIQRSLVEQCAEGRGLIGRRTHQDGWRANDVFVPHMHEDFDVALCSGSTYELVFSGPYAAEHVADVSGYTLEGKRHYTIETPDFHIIPGSGFPTDNLRISACDDFSIKLSNKYDLGRDNLDKIELWELEDGTDVPTRRIAGGRDCDPNADAAAVAGGAIPCLIVGVGGQWLGEITVVPDFARHGQILHPAGALGSGRYGLVIPGLDEPSQITDATAYDAAFLDACGMPLVTGGATPPDHTYAFTVDEDCPP